MTFDELLAQVVELLRRQGRVSYGALKRRFALDDAYLQDLKDELIDAQRVAVDEDGKVLVWVGGTAVARDQLPVASPQPPASSTQTLDPRRDAGERRQLTVMFCDLVGSTALSTRLDPEELRTVIRAYRETCATAIRRFDGYLAKYIGDGLLVYFGYPLAHEDDAQRAVRAGLEIVAAFHPAPSAGHKVFSLSEGEEQVQSRARKQAVEAPLPHGRGADLPFPHRLQVRIGIHTGLVVAGEMGVGDQPEPLAIVGETPNLAARLQQEAQPNTVVISAATYHLIRGYFECADLGLREVKGVPAPFQVYRVLGESGIQGRLEVAARHGLTPLVGREQEVGLLLGCWEQVKEGQGQVALLSGEAGVGKSRLVRVLRERIAGATRAWLECRCSPYHQNSALYPIIDLLQRVLGFTREDSPEEKLTKLVGAQHAAPLPPDTVPLFASLLSLPSPDGYPPLNLTPQRQKQKTLEALLTWLLAEAERQPVPFIVEDLHWADPSTLEFLGLLIEQVPTTRLLTILAFRPEFTPPWASRSHITQLTLRRLPRKHVEAMVEKLTGDQALPAAVVQQIVTRTDGVPLFVEELTKSVVESVGALRGAPLHLMIPTTLHDSLMARLDRLGPVKEIAQLGATLGREFSYEVLHAVSPLDETALQQGLRQLVEAELLYQRGLPPQATYLFKHALIQDAAYQSLLKSTRQPYHQQIAQVLEQRFKETVETQPELVAHHYTEAGLIAQAIPYWQRAGRRATLRSANIEAISHLTRGLELLQTLPDTPERVQQELTLQVALGGPLMATKGIAAREVEQAYVRALELCWQTGETPLLFPVLFGLCSVHINRAECETARERGEQLLRLAHHLQDPGRLVPAHQALGAAFFSLGELFSAREQFEKGVALGDLHQRPSGVFISGAGFRVVCRFYLARILWLLGYPDQALKRSREALALAQEQSYPEILVLTLYAVGTFHQFRQESEAVLQQSETAIALSSELAFVQFLAEGRILRGWALVERGQREEGIVEIRQGLAAWRAGAELSRPWSLTLLAEAYGKVGQPEQGLTALAEALAQVDKTEECYWEAELYRLKGELLLQSRQVKTGPESGVPGTQHPTPSTQAEAEAEACFLKAIEIARKQSAKSLELRAVMSLARLWQAQSKKEEAHRMLAEIYGWFTEGFDTKDLREAKALLEELTGYDP